MQQTWIVTAALSLVTTETTVYAYDEIDIDQYVGILHSSMVMFELVEYTETSNDDGSCDSVTVITYTDGSTTTITTDCTSTVTTISSVVTFSTTTDTTTSATTDEDETEVTDDTNKTEDTEEADSTEEST